MCLIEQKTLAIALIIRFLFLTKIGGLKVGENYSLGGKNREIVAGRDKNVITIMFTYFFIEFFFTHMLYRFVFSCLWQNVYTIFSRAGHGFKSPRGIVVIGSELATGVPLLTPRVLFFS